MRFFGACVRSPAPRKAPFMGAFFACRRSGLDKTRDPRDTFLLFKRGFKKSLLLGDQRGTFLG